MWTPAASPTIPEEQWHVIYPTRALFREELFVFAAKRVGLVLDNKYLTFESRTQLIREFISFDSITIILCMLVYYVATTAAHSVFHSTLSQ